jgi:hypothetical protein
MTSTYHHQMMWTFRLLMKWKAPLQKKYLDYVAMYFESYNSPVYA